MHPNLGLLSNSSNDVLHSCKRKYQLQKLDNAIPWSGSLHELDEGEELLTGDEQEYHTSFGSLVGIGTQEYLISGDVNKAYWNMFTQAKYNLEDEAGEKDGKTFYHALFAVDRFIGLRNSLLSDCIVPNFHGKPAVELGYTINCGNGFIHRGFIDALLLNTKTKELFPYEGKTTKSYVVHDAMYKNSGQALGYSIVIDTIAKQLELPYSSSFRVLYCPYKTKSKEWDPRFYDKNHLQRAMWIKSLMMDIEDIKRCDEDDYFPMNGAACYSFFRPCKYFGICEMATDLLAPQPMERKDDPRKFQFNFSLAQVIESQLAIQAMEKL